MIESRGLTNELRKLVRRLEVDVKEHCEARSELDDWLREEFARAREGGRTGQAFEAWREEQVTLSAVEWALSCVFIRFCEDNALIAEPRLAGPGERLEAAADTTRHHFQQKPGESDREYLLWVFEQAAQLPGMRGLIDTRESRMRELPLSVDGATELLQFWRRTDPASGEIVYDFTDPDRDTRFLGDLYQDLSEAARKRYALLQTPIFIEEFILDRTLDPAIADFGLADASLIDPACGSGHFLLGAFQRLLGRWREREPQTDIRVLCQRVFDQIAGIDINPYAVAIAHFRLLVAALNACDLEALRGAPDFKIEVATGDALLHGHPPDQLPDATGAWALPEHQHFYEVEDREKVTDILNRSYAAVVANPPYITPKDSALRDAYRYRYTTCHGKYALSVPFMQRLFDLAARPERGAPAGYVGQITSNSFMKREFGKKLVEGFLAEQVDLELIIDTAGAYIPGHGTPTVILVGRPRKPISEDVRVVMGIRGEPGRPEDPAKGKVWSEIVELLDSPGEEGLYVTCEQLERKRLARHPWSLQGGGASEAKEAIEAASERRIEDVAESVGITAVTGEDEIYLIGGPQTASRLRLDMSYPLIEGDELRDWQPAHPPLTLWCYSEDFTPKQPSADGGSAKLLWLYKTSISRRKRFGVPMLERGLNWWEWQELYGEKLKTPLSLAFSQLATHNHFVLSRGGSAFNRSAPVIKLQKNVSEDAYLGIIGPLNSSLGCFWIKQVSLNRGSTVDKAGARQTTAPFEDFFEHTSTQIARFPLASDLPLSLAIALDTAASELAAASVAERVREQAPTQALAEKARQEWLEGRHRLIALQEELDWRCYRLYDLLDEDLTHPLDELPDVELGERAFEILLARKLAAGEIDTAWFERHGSTPTTEIPERWPEEYRQLVQRRIEAIERVKAIRLIEQPEYKRRWTTLKLSEWEAMEADALRQWLLDRLESEALWPDTQLRSAAEIADRMLGDQEFQTALELFAGEDADPSGVVARLLAEESVPYLAALRYKPGGLEKRMVWERTWQLQREEDSGKFTGQIDVPPKYGKADFRSPVFWRHRGKLDVPKERFTSYPEAAVDGSTLYGWAGWDHAQRAQGLAQRIVAARETEGMETQRLLPLLAGLLELSPWLHQWHSEPDPQYGMPLSDFYDTFLDERTLAIGCTRDELAAWRPPQAQRGRRRKAAV